MSPEGFGKMQLIADVKDSLDEQNIAVSERMTKKIVETVLNCMETGLLDCWFAHFANLGTFTITENTRATDKTNNRYRIKYRMTKRLKEQLQQIKEYPNQ